MAQVHREGRLQGTQSGTSIDRIGSFRSLDGSLAEQCRRASAGVWFLLSDLTQSANCRRS